MTYILAITVVLLVLAAQAYVTRTLIVRAAARNSAGIVYSLAVCLSNAASVAIALAVCPH